MTKTQNGVEATLYTVVLQNLPGMLETLLAPLKAIDIVGLKLMNNGETGTVQFVVESDYTKTVSSILSREEFFFTTSIVYGVYLTNRPGSLLNTIVKPANKIGVNITNLFTAVGLTRVYVGFDDARKIVPMLRSIPVPTIGISERLPVAA